MFYVFCFTNIVLSRIGHIVVLITERSKFNSVKLLPCCFVQGGVINTTFCDILVKNLVLLVSVHVFGYLV